MTGISSEFVLQKYNNNNNNNNKHFKNTIWNEEIESKWRVCKLENASFCGKMSI